MIWPNFADQKLSPNASYPIAHGEFRQTWAPGVHNLGDFFTKAHPVHYFHRARALYVSDNPQIDGEGVLKP